MDNTVQTTDTQITAATVAITAATATVVATAEEVTLMSAPEKDLQQIRAAIDQLKAVGEQLFADEIAGLEVKAASLEEEIKNEAQAAESKINTWSENFREKHGISVQVAVVGGAFILSAVLRWLGVW